MHKILTCKCIFIIKKNVVPIYLAIKAIKIKLLTFRLNKIIFKKK